MSAVSVKFTFRESDHGFKKLVEMAKRIEAQKPYAKAGVLARKRERNDSNAMDNVTLAVIHEFGAPSAGIPERSFIRGSFNRNRPKYETLVRQLVTGLYEGKTTERQALGILGAVMSTDMKLGITSGGGIKPRDSDATLRRKAGKGSRPRGFVGPLQPRTLVDTGQLVGAISWAVVAGESDKEEGAAK